MRKCVEKYYNNMYNTENTNEFHLINMAMYIVCKYDILYIILYNILYIIIM